MKITFIRPNIGRLPNGPYIDEGRMEPLELGLLAAMTPPDVECVMYDDRMEAIPYDEPTDLVAITIEIYKARRAYEIAAEYRARGVPVIAGGFHPTLAPDECALHVDSVFVGDAETLWAEVVEDARAGRLKPRYKAELGTPQAGGIQPRRDLFKGKGYLPIHLVQFGRGCRFACDFCAISVFFERTQYARPVEEVIAELAPLSDKIVFFVDDNLISSHAHAKELLRALIPLKLRWISQGSIDMADDPELMELIEASGCLGFVIGFESIDPANIRRMRKASNLTRKRSGWDAYQAQVEVLRKHHLQIWSSFTLGHDNDTWESIGELYHFAESNKFCFAAFNILMPYPNTPLYTRLAAENRLLYGGAWWLHEDYRFNHAAFIPKQMTPDELTEATWRCRKTWNAPASILYRMCDPKTHMSSPYRLALYFAYNRLYSKETFKKQGMHFGCGEARFTLPLRRSRRTSVPLSARAAVDVAFGDRHSERPTAFGS
jgi:radical SAM superfamily enzyme YgiQ (UPF0313 family)